MCGIFAYFGNPDRGIVNQLAIEASRRGPHAYGWATAKGCVKSPGNLADAADRIPLSDWMIGNARMMTSGDYTDNRNNQPLVDNGITLTHNGNVYTYRAIYERLGYMPMTENDSEALIALCRHDPHWQRVILEEIAPSSPLAAILRTPGQTYIIRAGHPLYGLQTQDCRYYGSRPFHPNCVLVEWGIHTL